MKKEKRIKYIEAVNGAEFEKKVNESLKGLNDPEVQVFGKYEGCIIYTELTTEDEEKSIAELFEEAGCGATCSECPHFQKPTDGRKKWTTCGSRRISGETKACDSYYLERRNDVPEAGRIDENKGVGHHPARRMHKVELVESLPQEERGYRVLTA